MFSAINPFAAQNAFRNPLQNALQGLGVDTQQLLKAVQARGANDLHGYQHGLKDAFSQVQPNQFQQVMGQPFGVQNPVDAMARAQARQAGVGALGHLAGAAGGFALGGPLGAMAGLGTTSLIGHLKSQAMASRLAQNPGFRSQFEAQQGARFVNDGRNDGALTVAPRQFGIPGLGLGAGVLGGLGLAGGGLAAGSALSGMARMNGGLGGQLGRMTGMQFDPTMGLLGTPRGGRNTAMLGAGASFEDLVAAFMADTVEKTQKEVENSMRQMEMSNNSGGMGMKSMAGGIGGAVGGMLGGAAGGALGNAMQGGGATAGADSRQMMMEKLKNLMNKLQQMQQAMSNVLNTMHSGAMNSVRNIRA